MSEICRDLSSCPKTQWVLNKCVRCPTRNIIWPSCKEDSYGFKAPSEYSEKSVTKSVPSLPQFIETRLFSLACHHPIVANMFCWFGFRQFHVLLLTIFVTDHNSSLCFALQFSLACRCFWVVVVSEVRDHKTLACRDSQGTQFFQKKEKKLTGQVFGFIIRVGEIKLVFW
jgi:hypothetical protein